MERPARRDIKYPAIRDSSSAVQDQVAKMTPQNPKNRLPHRSSDMRKALVLSALFLGPTMLVAPPAAAAPRDHRVVVHPHHVVVRGPHRIVRHPRAFIRHDFRHFTPAEHRWWSGGRWRHTWWHGRYGWWWNVGPAWYFYDAPVYPYPTYVSPEYYDEDAYDDSGYDDDESFDDDSGYDQGAAPPDQYDGGGSWYHCSNPEGYYPYVKSCKNGWEQVPASPDAMQGPGSGPDAGPPDDQYPGDDDDQGPPPPPR
jgi:hypothetical protein